jgi:hypothetical protein
LTNRKDEPKLPRDPARRTKRPQNSAKRLFIEVFMSAASDRELSASNERKSEAEATGREGGQSSTPEIPPDEPARRRAAIDAILALRDSAKPVTLEEIRSRRHEGHGY